MTPRSIWTRSTKPASKAVRARVDTPLSAIDAREWDALRDDDDPFTSYAYLSALEDSGQIGPEAHWVPHHVTVRDAQDGLIGAMPLYAKDDSWGEFVFDFAWANAFNQAGGRYYPKLVTAVPYTPVGGRRLLISATADYGATANALIDATLDFTRAMEASSWHVQFCHPDEHKRLGDAGLLLRSDCQFHWFNDSYSDFDDYLTVFRSSRRKKTRRERRRMDEQGIRFTTRAGSELDQAAWQEFYGFYASSFLVRGRDPYFTSDLFVVLGQRLGDQMMIKTALRDDRPVAAALFFHNDRRLYGRYWGCTEFVDALHFETCYYQGIDYCIEHGLQQFDPGTQGEHKIARGFRAHESYSAHYLVDQNFRRAVADYLRREGDGVKLYMDSVDAHLPFRRGADDPGEA
ncbi:MAG: GNAT family N-acetyltransferase [Gammaproteobacteria bacterium]